MKKIISLFKRNYSGDRKIYNEYVENTQWVLNNEGTATRKFDGTCTMVKDGELYKRYDAKSGKTPPKGFISAQNPDTTTGHHPGWLKVNSENPSDKWFIAAWNSLSKPLTDGTYELCGPHFNANPENLQEEIFIKHGSETFKNVPTSFDKLKEWFENKNIEGIVWHRNNGEMVKIKKKDFGLKRINPE